MNQFQKVLLTLILLLVSMHLSAAQKPYRSPEIRTSVQLNVLSIKGMVRLKNAITSFFTAHGFPEQKDGFDPEYRKLFESSGQFAIDLYSTTGVHIFVESVRGCFLVHMQGPEKESSHLLSLKEGLNKSLTKEFHQEIKIYPNDVCGSAGFAHP